MNLNAQVADAGIAAAIGILSMLALSSVFPALAHPAALAIGAAAGLAIAFQDRLPLGSRSFRLAQALLAVASGAVVLMSLRPGYIGI